MTGAVALMIAGVLIVLVYDYTNGLQDAANMLATIVASRATTPIQAAILVSFFTFLGPILGGTAVANTIGNFVDVTNLESVASLTVILAGLAGAISWNLITWWFGLPASSSQALVGGLVGAVVVAAGPSHVVWGFAAAATGQLTGVTKVLGALLISPVLGFLFGWVTHRIMSFALRGARPTANRYLRWFQWLATAALAFSHGTNDAQKGMGIIAMLLVLGGVSAEFYVPLWVILASASAITLGTLAGGWRIVRTLGFGIYKVRPIHALDAQLTSAGVILAASAIGGPVSTTQVVSTAIMGIGASERPKAVRWNTARHIAGTWLITMPGAAAVSIGFYLLTRIALEVTG
ncbi:MAG: inorganic phosphate transporter [Tistrella sp.]|uniref:inorganic phosphate transporter n=1 Tax=Alphaproteobacteria TaxID=28211 RepID=UPI000A384F26|nr:MULTISPECIES: inorganic phosphate transporter [Alphaproteobacteria]MAD37071.1 inorganic phosphate transporter [Tistrella sp.]MBA77083.1 inorganic phosphate transporter [Tistrella sp.]